VDVLTVVSWMAPQEISIYCRKNQGAMASI
jgi:hypothetical protein